ncbi:dTDP-glucose 4,6-dehydratase [Oenococcus oeni]|uniref:dTDP-glucose 4,6-dehydratase n=1 Tax=Oenococcus oeni ATCC BAA-1163 TaxID=379360 RepID=A0NJQ4_OENOE|nr:dTDP-glucose 4,6-dehydratase [Oenococcus oeni]EAV39281.1 dTDP glucose 4, 6-dehydratase [Oenococcus oeni ATCC BAA-1163]EJO03438.1 dTDP-glucose 4,6-dehydratase [Oenococcus oeni AWRIB418]KEP87940.1 spore coat protein [Oenococcus oeni IOEB_0501]QGR01854.1 dTDP-glucose 4,6-dehydratase [Oenococcus oeni]TEU21634.1 dTDP-glucose 4,6-dehydratase [Oenococcus oeni]
MAMNILVTGGAGFIGSNFVHYMLKAHPDYNLIDLDLLTYAGNLHNFDDIKNESHHIFIHGDIRNAQLVDYLFKTYDFDAVVNFAAESHVDRSILHPEIFVQTNVEGTVNLLQTARKYGIKKYLQVSTDEVYGSLGKEGYFNEESPLAPNSPYSASKAAADLETRAFYETYGLNINITRTSNNYGPYQFPEKLIPLMVTNGMTGGNLPIYGDGENIRDWLYVEDHGRAIDLVLHQGKSGEIYNVGGHNEKTNNQIVDLIVENLGLSKDRIKYVKDRLGHDRRYAIDPSKIKRELGWEPTIMFDKGIIKTIDWYKEHEDWWKPLKSKAALK